MIGETSLYPVPTRPIENPERANSHVGALLDRYHKLLEINLVE